MKLGMVASLLVMGSSSAWAESKTYQCDSHIYDEPNVVIAYQVEISKTDLSKSVGTGTITLSSISSPEYDGLVHAGSYRAIENFEFWANEYSTALYDFSGVYLIGKETYRFDANPFEETLHIGRVNYSDTYHHYVNIPGPTIDYTGCKLL